MGVRIDSRFVTKLGHCIASRYAENNASTNRAYNEAMSTQDFHGNGTAGDRQLRRRAEDMGGALQTSLARLIGQLQSSGLKDQKALQGALGLSQSVVSRLVTSVRQGDPLATLCSVPGPEALRQLLKGASRAGADAPALRAAESALADFESFVGEEIGDRATLDAVLSDWVRESRAGFEMRHKAAAFKAMSALRGVQADLVFSTGILHPSPQAGRHDCIGLDGVLGCRRTRPSGALHLAGYTLTPDAGSLRITNLERRAPADWLDMLLPGFSNVAAEAVHTSVQGGTMRTTVDGLPLGRSRPEGADLVCAQWLHAVQRAHRRDEGDGAPTAGLGGQAEPPTACYIVDALLHDDVWPGVEPELRLYDTVVRGVAHPDDPARDSDRIDMLEGVAYLGRGLDAFRMPEYPRYTALVAHACAQAGWDASRLRGYRCTVRYPVYGAQIGLAFKLPLAVD
jgi:hypothetical protein